MHPPNTRAPWEIASLPVLLSPESSHFSTGEHVHSLTQSLTQSLTLSLSKHSLSISYVPGLPLVWTSQSGPDMTPALWGSPSSKNTDRRGNGQLYSVEGHWQVWLGAVGPPRRHLAQKRWSWKLPEGDDEKLSIKR